MPNKCRRGKLCLEGNLHLLTVSPLLLLRLLRRKKPLHQPLHLLQLLLLDLRM